MTELIPHDSATITVMQVQFENQISYHPLATLNAPQSNTTYARTSSGARLLEDKGFDAVAEVPPELADPTAAARDCAGCAGCA